MILGHNFDLTKISLRFVQQYWWRIKFSTGCYTVRRVNQTKRNPVLRNVCNSLPTGMVKPPRRLEFLFLRCCSSPVRQLLHFCSVACNLFRISLSGICAEGRGYYWIVLEAKWSCISKIIIIIPFCIWYNFKYVKIGRQNATDIIIYFIK